LAGNQNVNDNTGPKITWSDFQTSDAATFATGADNIGPLVDGVYALTIRIIWATVTDHWDAQVFFDNIDSDAAWNTAFPARGSTTQQMTTATGIFRLAAGQYVSAYVFQHSGALWVIDGVAGTYFEMIRLGSATMTDRAGS
jgi:hypothetical protein